MSCGDGKVCNNCKDVLIETINKLQTTNYCHVSNEPINIGCSRCMISLKGIPCWFINNKYVCVECKDKPESEWITNVITFESIKKETDKEPA